MAAAYAALVSLFNDLEAIANHQFHSFSFESKQIQSLLQILTSLIKFMENFDNSHLESRITSAAYAARSVIESHVVHQIRSRSTINGKRRFRFFLDLQKVIDNMDCLSRRAFKNSNLKQPTYSLGAAPSSSSSSSTEKNKMVGFDDVLNRLLNLLTGEDSSLRVITIVGSAGIGKTTLTRNAFEHRLMEHFDVCLWATISRNYVFDDILLKLLSREKKRDSESVGDLIEQLHRTLLGQRYLVVLDDMWSLKAWEDIQFCFKDENNGSRVVVTTRQSNLFDCIGSARLAIDLLDEVDSWDLFCERTFGGEACPDELEEVGKRIVKKCRGLPLAIVVVAGFLCKSSRMLEYWENVANNIGSIYNSDENKELLDVLSFSYSHLPCHLKPCFIYMGTYREDAEIRGSDLVKRWIAEGFLKPSESKTLEEIGKDYLKDLTDRNLIIPLKRLPDGKRVGIHDVLRELSIKIAQKEKFLRLVDAPRSLPLVHSTKEKELEVTEFLEQVGERYVNEDFLDDADTQQVNLRYVIYRDRPKTGSLYHIRTPLSSLWNLQTLIIYMDEYCAVPHEFWQMLHLRNLDVYPGIYLPDPCDSSDKVLRNLWKVKHVVNWNLSEEICKRIPNLKKLCLIYDDTALGFPTSNSYHCLHNLCHFHKLESLVCEFGESAYDLKPEFRELGSSLILPSSLKQLSLRGCGLDWEEITSIVECLPHLESLHLLQDAFMGSELVIDPEEITFPSLKFLTIYGCEELVVWNADSSSFKKLECITLGGLPSLEELPSGIGEITTLRCIRLFFCTDSLFISAVTAVNEGQEEYMTDNLQLEVYTYTRVESRRLIRKLQEEDRTINNLTFHSENSQIVYSNPA